MKEVLRQEKKFLLSLPQMYQLNSTLSQIMAQDPHNGPDGYTVRSLYFDSLDDRDFFEKEDGLEIRRKIRLRTYSSDTSFALLEMKQKQSSLQKKRSLKLKSSDAQQLAQGNYSVLFDYDDPFAAECSAVMKMGSYRPCSVVEFRRKAFTAKENRIRVTLDHHLTTTESCFDLFSPTLLQNSALDPSLAVLEVKYNGFLLSYIKDLLAPYCGSEHAISKYRLSRGVSRHVIF